MTRGFRKFKEINTVTYHPDLISETEMIAALKRAHTYIGVAERINNTESGK